MDALIYTVMSGAERALRAQQVHANNLANADTPGFRADLELAVSTPVTRGYGYDARHMSRLEAGVVSSRQGPLRETGRELDVAIVGPGYFTVQWRDGEAYTRSGAFSVDADGTLTLNGRPVLGDGGPIVLPAFTRLEIGTDGVISIQPPGETELQPVDRLKLVRPAADEVTKNEDGLIVARSGEALPPDDTVQVRSGHLEGSNVSAIEEMIATMNLTREFEVQMKLYSAADSMAEAGNRLLRE
ncbi:MAG: flagellar basal body rod protein FlgF [Pseudomonadota bacterium]|jgi:fagellar hook-basal body proteins|nr:MAG: flagellar biosynthesis protein FlgF [Pseudomonadota bacterium]